MRGFPLELAIAFLAGALAGAALTRAIGRVLIGLASYASVLAILALTLYMYSHQGLR